jgi:acetyl/propionyl-CoA carboxylase alpha subunit
MRLRCGDELFEPRVRAGRDGVVEVVLGERVLPVRLEPVAAGVFLAREGGRARLLHVARDGGRVHLFWDGVAYALEEEREGARRGTRPDSGALEAPMPGRVSAVKTSPGSRVEKGDELLVVEAMKMENALRAPRAGTVRAVHAAVGDMVGPGRPLVELEP